MKGAEPWLARSNVPSSKINKKLKSAYLISTFRSSSRLMFFLLLLRSMTVEQFGSTMLQDDAIANDSR